MGVDGHGVAVAVGVGHLLKGRLIEAVPADIVDQIVQGYDGIGVDHLHHLARLSGGHIGDVAGGQTRGPLGVEVGPGKGLDIDFYLGMIRHELIRRSLNGLQPGTLGKRMPERDLALKLVGLGRLAGGGCLSVRGLGRGS